MIKAVEGWRKGQTLFNFLEWLRRKGYAEPHVDVRMGDPFHISDEDLDMYWDKFYGEYSSEQEEKGNTVGETDSQKDC